MKNKNEKSIEQEILEEKELRFWEEVYCICLNKMIGTDTESRVSLDAKDAADLAVSKRRDFIGRQ